MNANPMLKVSRQDLARKLASLEGPLSDYWQFFLRRCLRHPEAHPIDLVVAYLGTGQRDYLERFAGQFRQFVETLPSRDLTNQGQFHAWTNALPLTRWLLAYDLVADEDVFDAAFRDQAARAWLGYADRLLWPVVRSRVQTGDNQFFAVCLGCAVIGRLFGHARGTSALGRDMAAYALRRLPDAIGSLPAGGYSGEGYYHNQVVATLATLCDAVMPALTGENAFERALPPNGVSLRDILEVDYRTVMPGGLMVPWDASYFHPLHVKMNLVYLARRTGNPEFLRPVKRYRLFEADPRPGWGRDDDAWTWLWWPDNVRSFDQVPGDALHSWARQYLAFGLVEPEAESGLFQNFDISAHSNPPGVSRLQSDPNSLVLIGQGVPLILDGGSARHEDVFPDTHATERGRVALTGFGFHNSLTFQGEDAVGVLQTTAGRLTRFFRSPVLSLGEADVTEHYTAYGVREVRRRSLSLGDGLYLVADEVTSTQPADVTWNLWTRPYARLEGDRIVVDTPEQVRLAIVPPRGTLMPLQTVRGMPAVLENAASRVRVRTQGAQTRLTALLQVAGLTEPVADLSSGWELAVADGADNAWETPGAAWPVAGTVDTWRGASVQLPDLEPQPLPQRFIWDYMDRRDVAPVGRYDRVDFSRAAWLRRRVTVPASAAGRRLFVRIERPPWYFRFFVNGVLVAGHGMTHPTALGDGNPVAPGVIEVAASATAGQTLDLAVAIASPYTSTAMGHVSLVAARTPELLACEEEGPWRRLTDGSRRLLVLPYNPKAGCHPQPNGGARFVVPTTGPASDGADGAAPSTRCEVDAARFIAEQPKDKDVQAATVLTDAETAVLRHDGAWAAVRATVFTVDGRDVLHCRYGRISAAYEDGHLTIHEIDDEAVCEIHLAEGRVVLQGGKLWEGLALLERPLSVHVPDGQAWPGILWKQPVSETRCGEERISQLSPSSNTAEGLGALRDGDVHAREEAVSALAANADRRIAEALREALLRDRCWTVRCAAARVLGQRLERDAVPDLLAVLAGEQARDVYGGLTDQNDFPQWPGGSNGDPLAEFARLPAAAREEPESGVPSEFSNRFRLKQAVIEALGLIGDERAYEAVAAVLKPSDGQGGLGMTGGDFYPVRKAAAEALGLIGDPRALPALRQVAEDEDEINTRYAAQQAVGWLTGRAVPRNSRGIGSTLMPDIVNGSRDAAI